MNLINTKEQAIPREDEERYMRVMAEFDAAMVSYGAGPVPTCHMTPMEFHECDSDPSGRSDGYQCKHCGHSESSEAAWTKVDAREQRKKQQIRAAE